MRQEVKKNLSIYDHNDLSVIRLKHNSKAPAVRSLKKYFYQKEKPMDLFLWRGNFGLMMGEISGNIIALDFDVPEAFDQFSKDHPHIVNNTAIQKTSKGYHVLIKYTRHITKFPALYKGKRCGDVIGNTGYIVAAPSIHPDTGIEYKWIQPIDEYGIAEVDDLDALGFSRVNGNPIHSVENETGGETKDKLKSSLPNTVMRRPRTETTSDYSFTSNATYGKGTRFEFLQKNGFNIYREFKRNYSGEELECRWKLEVLSRNDGSNRTYKGRDCPQLDSDYQSIVKNFNQNSHAPEEFLTEHIEKTMEDQASICAIEVIAEEFMNSDFYPYRNPRAHIVAESKKAATLLLAHIAGTIQKDIEFSDSTTGRELGYHRNCFRKFDRDVKLTNKMKAEYGDGHAFARQRLHLLFKKYDVKVSARSLFPAIIDYLLDAGFFTKELAELYPNNDEERSSDLRVQKLNVVNRALIYLKDTKEMLSTFVESFVEVTKEKLKRNLKRIISYSSFRMRHNNTLSTIKTQTISLQVKAAELDAMKAPGPNICFY